MLHGHETRGAREILEALPDWGGRVLSALGALGLSLPLAHEGRGGEPGMPAWTWYDLSADAPHDHAGVMPPLLALTKRRAQNPTSNRPWTGM